MPMKKQQIYKKIMHICFKMLVYLLKHISFVQFIVILNLSIPLDAFPRFLKWVTYIFNGCIFAVEGFIYQIFLVKFRVFFYVVVNRMNFHTLFINFFKKNFWIMTVIWNNEEISLKAATLRTCIRLQYLTSVDRCWYSG